MKPDRFHPHVSSQSSLHRELSAQFYSKNHIPFVIAVLSSLLLGLLNLMLSWMIQQFIDTISGVPGSMELSAMFLLSAVVILLVILFKLMDYFSRPRFLEKAVRQYKDLAFHKLTQKNISSFQEESTATYISAMSNDIASIEQNLLENQFALAANGILFFGSVFMMLSYSPLLTAASALLSFLPFLGSMAAGDRMKTAETRVSKQNEQFVASLKDSLSGFSVIKSFKAEAPILELFSKSNQAAEEAKCRRRKLEAFLGMIGSAAGVTAQLGVFLIGAWLALTGSGLTPGTVLVFVNLMNFIIDPITQMPTLLVNRKAALALIRKLSDALEEHSGRGGQAIQSRLTDGILLDHVSFAYEDGTDVLHDLTFRFESGKSYALVGASGSGKSTLLNLLMAAHDTYRGSICYDEHELRSISSDSLFDLVAVIQQNVFVFQASIRDNITMFRPFPKEDVDRVIQLSGLSSLMEEKGEAYLCGENGSGLSGGERQRISIARSLLRNTHVLLADEATASLDKETANHVVHSLLSLDGLTRIVVTHALDASVLKQFDGILALKDGRLVEYGTFDALMENKNYFYSLFTVSQ